ncbi:ceramidase domain-containing protein [Roseovarius sp.]|uniref:ceramidase domain-containing protein n=1 Tax=Roseovarius sp. TaxID=1486281 RepID=UPI0026124B0A|nr:ceramidase domain-containing protein [Roseovarius sp.]MDM8166853.1 ceramidase domain-containing protein [Roseovarius sp.]
MDWFASIDGYCERLGPAYWAEPVNAVTNLAFLVAATVMAWRLRGAHLPLAKAMVVLLAVIGIGSFLFHTHAERWAALADTTPILAFILVYLYASSRDYLRLSKPWSLVSVGLFFPFAAVLVPLFAQVPVLSASAGYLPVVVLIAGYAVVLARRASETARGLALGAGLLFVSITLRSLDMPLCESWPIGTHFAWHLLNGLLLGWMIEVYRRHMLARRPHGG